MPGVLRTIPYIHTLSDLLPLTKPHLLMLPLRPDWNLEPLGDVSDTDYDTVHYTCLR